MTSDAGCGHYPNQDLICLLLDRGWVYSPQSWLLDHRRRLATKQMRQFLLSCNESELISVLDLPLFSHLTGGQYGPQHEP